MVSQQESLYEQLFPLTTVMRQRVVENFSGATLNERWATSQVATPIFGMSDTINGGYFISVDSASDQQRVHFNDIRQYSFNASVCLLIIQGQGFSVSGGSNYGLAGNKDQASPVASDGASWQQTTGITWLATGNSGGRTLNNIGRLPDDLVHFFKIECNPSNVVGTIDNVVSGTNTTNLPVGKMQPMFTSQFESSATTTFARYVEAYNT